MRASIASSVKRAQQLRPRFNTRSRLHQDEHHLASAQLTFRRYAHDNATSAQLSIDGKSRDPKINILSPGGMEGFFSRNVPPPSSNTEMFTELDTIYRSNGGNLISKQLLQNDVVRGNLAETLFDHVLNKPATEEEKAAKWFADKIFDGQIVRQFLNYMEMGILPSGKPSALPRPTLEERQLLLQPLLSWAPALTRSTSETFMERVLATADGGEGYYVSAEMRAIKRGLLLGKMPLSERAWVDSGLDDLRNLSVACQYFTMVTNVFRYIEIHEVRSVLFQRSSLVREQFQQFDKALAEWRAEEGPVKGDNSELTDLWSEYVVAYYTDIADRAHQWVETHSQRLAGIIFKELSSHQPQVPGDEPDARQWELTNMLHDVNNLAANASYVIFSPFAAAGLPNEQITSQSGEVGKFLAEPIAWSPSVTKRQSDQRRRIAYLSRVNMFEDSAVRNTPTLLDLNDPKELAGGSMSTYRALKQARTELRGEPPGLGLPLWARTPQAFLSRGGQDSSWSLKICRLCHDHSEEEWETFKAKFEEDIGNWGQEHRGIDDLRAAFKVQWQDGKEHGIADNDLEAARRHFFDLAFRKGSSWVLLDSLLLVADKATIDSYVKPKRQQNGSILCLDLIHKPGSGQENPHSGQTHNPAAYDGQFRILGSLVWDDLAALTYTNSSIPEDFWRLAAKHPDRVYNGPLGQ